MLAAMALSGTIGLLVVESGQPPVVVVFFRCLIGGAALLAWLAFTRAWQPFGARALTWLVIGGAALVANWLCLFSAYRFTSISVATVVYQTQPFMLLVLAALLRQERLDVARLPWVGVAMLGVLLSSGLGVQGLDGATWHGVGLALAAAALYAVATLATQRLPQLPSSQIAAVQMVLGVVLLAPLAWGHARPGSAVAWGALATLGLVHTAFMYTLMYAAFQRLPSSAIAMLSFVYPAVALLVDLAWYGAWPQPLQWLGMALILGAVLAHRRAGAAARPTPVPSPTTVERAA
ncbi:DMT family transporter [Aquincola sp. S2]|uniref:DMT family transporter n=2 Tax=Pseudaquabacterium terrae TaxID=2732868 RepID=A0ABX2EAP1_9BURK|nr:DMT family transporter [Aquabacterium terrae]